GTAQITRRKVDRHRHRKLARLVRLCSGLSVIEVWGERDVTLAGHSVRDVFDVGDKSPPLLDHDDAWAAAGGGQSKVSVGGATVAGKRHRLTGHVLHLLGFQ